MGFSWSEPEATSCLPLSVRPRLCPSTAPKVISMVKMMGNTHPYTNLGVSLQEVDIPSTEFCTRSSLCCSLQLPSERCGRPTEKYCVLRCD